MAQSKNKYASLNRVSTRENDGAFYNAHQVYNIFDNYSALIFAATTEDSAIQDTLIDGLNDLLKILQTQEAEFYSLFKLSGPAAVKEINTRAMQWNHTGASTLLDTDFAYSIFKQIQIIINEQEVIDGLNTILQSGEYYNFELQAPISDLLNEVFNKTGQKGSFSSTKKAGVNKVLELKNINNQLQIQVKQGEALSEGIKAKIATYINNSNDLGVSINIIKQNFSTIKEIIYSELDTVITDAFAKQCIYYELFSRDPNAYNFCYNFQVFKGWLGEVYWNAGFSYLFQTLGITLPSGNIKNTHGQSLSVDIIFRNFGFQVKNWHTNDMKNIGTHTSKYRRRFGNFLDSRAQLLSTYIGDIIADMFGAISYNKPTDKEEYQSDSFSEYQTNYDIAERTLQESYTALEQIFQARLNKIISIDNGGLLEKPINNVQEFYNTFWLINETVIPSSLIISKLIEKLKHISEKSYVNFSLINFKDLGGPVWPNTTNFSRIAMANRWTIDYAIEFDLASLIKEVTER